MARLAGGGTFAATVKRGLRLTSALLLLTALAVPEAADAGISSVTIGGLVTPDPVSTLSAPVSLTLTYDAVYTSGFTPRPQRLTYHLDNDIAVDVTGIPQCPLAAITNAPRANALAACPSSVVGSGTTQWVSSGPNLNGMIDVFNGQPAGQNPTIYLHDALYNTSNMEVVDTTSVATLSPSALGGDFGTQISFGWPPVGLATRHLDFTLNNLEPTPGHHFWTAGCGDADRTLNFVGDFIYEDASTRSATATEPCTPTGRRAKALKKCKKKNSKQARRRCRKKAKQLPV